MLYFVDCRSSLEISIDGTFDPGGVVRMPEVFPSREGIRDFVMLTIEDGVKALWKEGIYAESSMGCTGPVIKVASKNLQKAESILRSNGYI